MTGCKSRQGRACLSGWLAISFGAVRPAEAGERGASDPALRWGRVRDGGALVGARPRPDGEVLEVLRPPYPVALLEDESLQQRGWLQRPGGGYVEFDRVLSSPALYGQDLRAPR